MVNETQITTKFNGNLSFTSLFCFFVGTCNPATYTAITITLKFCALDNEFQHILLRSDKILLTL